MWVLFDAFGIDCNDRIDCNDGTGELPVVFKYLFEVQDGGRIRRLLILDPLQLRCHRHCAVPVEIALELLAQERAPIDVGFGSAAWCVGSLYAKTVEGGSALAH